MREGGRLSGGAHGNNPVYSTGDLVFDELAEALIINFSLAEWGDECGVGASEHGSSQLHCDLAFKDKIGGASQNHLTKALSSGSKCHLEGVTSLDENADR